MAELESTDQLPDAPLSDQQRRDLNNALMLPWDDSMDAFFDKVEREAERRGHSVKQVEEALVYGYGDVVADHWTQWNEDQQ